MKKTMIALTVFTALLCTSCGSTNNEPAQTTALTVVTTAQTTVSETTLAETTQPETTQAETAEASLSESSETTQSAQEETSETVLQDEGMIYLKAGTWLSYGAGEYGYYFFNDDGTTGSIANTETGDYVPFSYEVDDDKVIFHMWDIENYSPATVEQTDEDNAVIKWEEGIQETLTYISEQDVNNFAFYSNNQLCEMALKYYASTTTEDTSNLVAAAMTNEDGTVTIQIYQNLGDHNSTAVWYTVDRISASGIDDMDNFFEFAPID